MPDRTTELMQALEGWATDAIPGMQTFPDDPTSLDKPFPLVVADAKRERVVSSEPGGFQQYEQTRLRIWSVELWLMVDPEEAWVAQQELYDYVEKLGLAMRRDKTLGGRVQFASPEYDASYEPSEVEYPDGTVARAATFRITVGEQVEV